MQYYAMSQLLSPEPHEVRQYRATAKPLDVNAEALFTVSLKNGDAVSDEP